MYGAMNKYLWIVLGCVVTGISALWIAAGQLSAAAPAKIGTPPSGSSFEVVSFAGVHGWYLPVSGANSCILLMHGVRSNRREMIARAVFFSNEGFSSLAIDLQAHGEAPGEAITFGYKEAESARNAVVFLREVKRCNKVVALGNSLGGAAALLGPMPLNVEGYILEAVFPSVQKAVRNRLRMRIGKIGDLIAPLLYQQIPIRLGIHLNQLQPAEAIKNIKAPVLIINGTDDRRTTPEDALRLYANAPESKAMLWIEGAGHTNLFEFERATYASAVLKFLSVIE